MGCPIVADMETSVHGVFDGVEVVSALSLSLSLSLSLMCAHARVCYDDGVGAYVRARVHACV